MLIPQELILSAKEKLGDKAAFIIAEDLQLEQFDETHLKALCPFHSEDTSSFIWNSKDNSYKCFGCQKVYGILDHYMVHYKLTFLGAVERLFKEADIPFRFGERGVKTQRDYVYPHEENSDRSKVEEYWATRHISPSTLDFARVGADEKGNAAFHYYDDNDVLCLVKYRPSRKVNKSESKFWSQKDTDTLPLLYGMNHIDPTKPLLICEGEGDALSIIECSHKNVVSIPFGAGNMTWIEHNWDWLEQFQELIIWGDNDKPGVDMRKEVCSRLGFWRCKYVDLPHEITGKDGVTHKVKDANEVLFYFGKEKVLDFIYNAQEVPVQNVVDLAEVDDFDIETAPGLYSGLKGIDDIVYKFIYGSVVLLTGRRGHGKSTLLNQMFVCNALNQGEDVFIFSGELGNSVLRNWIETTMIGREKITMKNDFVRIFDQEAVKKMRDWYRGRIWVFDDIENSSDKILDRAINVKRRFGCNIWIIDNLLTLEIGINGEGDQWLRQKEFIVKLVSLAKIYNVLIVLVGHPKKIGGLDINRRLATDDVAGSGDLGNLAQYMLSVHRFSKKERDGEMAKNGKGYVKGKEPIDYNVAVDVLKNRYTGKVGESMFYFDYPSYRFYNTPENLWTRYKWNDDISPLRTDDPNKHHEAPEGFGDN